MTYRSKHIGKTYGAWYVERRAGLGTFKLICTKCGDAHFRRVQDAAAGRSKGCLSCYSHSPDRKTKKREYVSGKNAPGWKGTKDIPGIYFTHMRRNAKLRNFSISVTPEEIQRLWETQSGRCALSGQLLSFRSGDLHKASLDRIDSNLGYIPGNLQWVSKTVNYMKRDLDQEVFLELCKAIHFNGSK